MGGVCHARRPQRGEALAAADTSLLLTCSAAAISDWLIPPFATARRIFLYLLMGISPFRCHGTPD